MAHLHHYVQLQGKCDYRLQVPSGVIEHLGLQSFFPVDLAGLSLRIIRAYAYVFCVAANRNGPVLRGHTLLRFYERVAIQRSSLVALFIEWKCADLICLKNRVHTRPLGYQRALDLLRP